MLEERGERASDVVEKWKNILPVDCRDENGEKDVEGRILLHGRRHGRKELEGELLLDRGLPS